MSSVSGQMGLFGQANYSSSKAAIIALTKVSAREFARQNITVNAVAPGFIDVGMSKGMPEEVTQNFNKQIPLGRLGEVSEIVDAALFLASPMASLHHRARAQRERRILHGLSGPLSAAALAKADQSSFCTSNQTKPESTAANVDNTNVARLVCRILNAGLGISS